MIKRLCLVCGCHNYREEDSKYCKKHREEYEAKDNKAYQDYLDRKYNYYQSIPKKEDDKEKRRYYNSARWREMYKRLLDQNPVCECCRQRPSKHVHHCYDKGYYYWNDEDFYNESMLVCLCNECHSRIHAELRRD